MKLVAIVFRKSLESEVFALFRACRVRAFTDIADVLGVGETGVAVHTFTQPAVNSLVLAALADTDAERVVDALLQFHDREVARQHGAGVPFHVFVLPCEQVV